MRRGESEVEHAFRFRHHGGVMDLLTVQIPAIRGAQGLEPCIKPGIRLNMFPLTGHVAIAGESTALLSSAIEGVVDAVGIIAPGIFTP